MGFFGIFCALALASCSSVSTLPGGLTARMDQAGAQLDIVEAQSLINQLRAANNVAPLSVSPQLTQTAAALASAYATSGNRPSKPEEASLMLISAGYANFAETFSGWRGSAADAQTLANPAVTSMGLGVAYAADSTYGVHWVLLLGQ